ncbi:MAG: hypothetical protein HQ549_01275 [Candidatus Omnitrophica bacterium]|nr:hypothetical protein [Candidatus Omnitrophota bacterium]
MKIIIITGRKSHNKTRLMVELFNKKAIGEIESLIHAFKCREAMSNVISKGNFIKELTENETIQTTSDLILTETNAYWNLL